MPKFREVKKRRRRERIYEAAIALLNEKGFSETGMRDISERAELAVGTLYNYYSSKYELYMEILEEKWAEMTRRRRGKIIKLVLHGRNLREILPGIIEPFVSDVFDIGMDRWSELFMAVFSSKSYLERGARMDEEAVMALVSFLDRLKRRGLVRRDVDASDAAFSLYSIVGFTFMEYLFIRGGEGKKNEFIRSLEKRLEILIDGLGIGEADTEYAREEEG